MIHIEKNNIFLILAILFLVIGGVSEFTRKARPVGIRIFISVFSVVLFSFFLYKYIDANKIKKEEKKHS